MLAEIAPGKLRLKRRIEDRDQTPTKGNLQRNKQTWKKKARSIQHHRSQGKKCFRNAGVVRSVMCP